MFPQPSVRLELSEAAEIGAQLPLPSAVDFDAGSNGACEYRLEPPADDDHPYFLLQATPRRRWSSTGSDYRRLPVKPEVRAGDARIYTGSARRATLVPAEYLMLVVIL